jgi:glycosyltransferase involved in cell wall biosynthesis
LPALRYGGPIVSVHGLCKALARRGHAVHVYTTNMDGPGVCAVPLDADVNLDGVQVRYFPVPGLRRLYWSPAMGSALREQIAGFDIVHNHSVFLWPTWAAARAARRAGVPYVLAPRGMLVKDLIRRKNRWLKTAWINLIERTNLRNAAAIHVTSALEELDMRALGLHTGPAALIANGVDPAAPAQTLPPSPALAERAGERFVLFIGRINWKKGLDRLIPAMRHLPDTRLLIAGNDEEAYQPVLEALAQTCGVRARIDFLGAVHGIDKDWLLAHAAALVLPSYSENFGNVVLEAMAAGCPAVLTPEVGAADIVREAGAGLVVAGDPDILGPALAALVADPEARARMGQRGHDMVTARYSWDAAALAMEQTYLDLLASPRRPAGTAQA